jgi:hypothetical protein
MRQKIACLSVASLLFLAYFDKGEICFLENLILFAFILFVIYHFIFGNYCLTIVQLSFNYRLTIVFACAVTPCKVQRGCYTTLKAKSG